VTFPAVSAAHTISATCNCPNVYPECNGVAAWVATVDYRKNNKVIYNGRLY